MCAMSVLIQNQGDVTLSCIHAPTTCVCLFMPTHVYTKICDVFVYHVMRALPPGSWNGIVRALRGFVRRQ